jgi:hypothetical protein
MKQLLLFEALILGVFVLLGNGIRSIGMTTVSVSQGEFASFLNISVHRTEILIEALLGGALIALVLAPFVLSRRSAVTIARNAALLAASCYAAIGITMYVNPSLLTRELVVISSFAFAGFAVAFFAPLAQLAIADLTSEKSRTALTTVWTAAQPIAFLITPQLVKYVAFDIGVGNFFLMLAALPLLFLALMPWVFLKTEQPETAVAPIPWKRLSVVIGIIVLFQGWTAAITLVGMLSPAAITFMACFLISVALVGIYFKKLFPQASLATQITTQAKFLLLLLLLIQIPTTGLYDSAYLYRHLCSPTFMADRATVGAIFQIAGVFATGALLLRRPQLRTSLLGTGLLLVLLGTALTTLYPFRLDDTLLFNGSKVVVSLGMGVSTAVLVSGVLQAAVGNKLIVMAPAFIIIIGTELGIEILEIAFELSELAGMDENGAYQVVFMAQLTSMILVVGLMALRKAAWLSAAVAHKPLQPA